VRDLAAPPDGVNAIFLNFCVGFYLTRRPSASGVWLRGRDESTYFSDGAFFFTIFC
jgi:hypothetical protein